jgi:hypothetical protein
MKLEPKGSGGSLQGLGYGPGKRTGRINEQGEVSRGGKHLVY